MSHVVQACFVVAEAEFRTGNIAEWMRQAWIERCGDAILFDSSLQVADKIESPARICPRPIFRRTIERKLFRIGEGFGGTTLLIEKDCVAIGLSLPVDIFRRFRD